MPNSHEIAEIDPIYGCLATQHSLGGVGIERLMGRFGNAAAVYATGPTDWKDAHAHLTTARIDSLRRGPDLKAWEALRARCEALGIRMTAPGCADYPEPLRALPGPPPLLFAKGRWRPEDARAVALVGTRDPTEYGHRAARALARDFAEAGYCVVSGLAAGIDGAAHRGAIEGGGRTIAVIGCGLDIEYPLENLEVRAKMEEDGGARGLVISEFPPETVPHPAHFPRRNRLISALSQAVIVVEAGGRSGALLTAACARDQGRPLFAVPGPIFSAVSAGTTMLLRRGAYAVSSIRDVIQVLEGHAPRRTPLPEPAPYDVETVPRTRGQRAKGNAARPKPAAKHPVRNSGTARVAPTDDALGAALWELWESEETCGLDALAARAVARGLWAKDKASNALLERLLHLELQGRVRRLPGAVYRRT
jgi:DNA processing protein